MLNKFFESKVDPTKIKDVFQQYGLELPNALRTEDIPNAGMVYVAALRDQGKVEEAKQLQKSLMEAKEPDIKKPKWFNIASIIVPIVLAFLAWSSTMSYNALAVPEIKDDIMRQERLLEEQQMTQRQLMEMSKQLKETASERHEDMKEHVGRLYQSWSRIDRLEKKIDDLILENNRLRVEFEALRKQIPKEN